MNDAAASGLGFSISRAGGAGLPKQARLKGLLRGRSATLAMAPFVIYTFLGLGIPTLAVIELAFRSEAGKLTLSNLHTVTQGTYRLGFENSILLAALTSIVPGILGLIIAYAIQTGAQRHAAPARRDRFRRARKLRRHQPHLHLHRDTRIDRRSHRLAQLHPPQPVALSGSTSTRSSASRSSTATSRSRSWCS